MSDETKNTYLPDYLVTPGEVLLDFLEGLSITQAELSDRTGLTRKTINGIVKAKEPISPETALKLERALGRSAQYWSNLERNYQDDKVRLTEKARMEAQLYWLDNFPINEMAKLGWIQKVKDKVEQLEILLRFLALLLLTNGLIFGATCKFFIGRQRSKKKVLKLYPRGLGRERLRLSKNRKYLMTVNGSRKPFTKSER
jgi:addiction module HigA family antidote